MKNIYDPSLEEISSINAGIEEKIPIMSLWIASVTYLGDSDNLRTGTTQISIPKVILLVAPNYQPTISTLQRKCLREKHVQIIY